jgi:hypothetical protein
MFMLYPRASFSFFFNSIGFVTIMSEKRKSASPSAIQIKNRRKTSGIEEKLSVIVRRGKGERIVDICSNAVVARGVLHEIHDNADRIRGSA